MPLPHDRRASDSIILDMSVSQAVMVSKITAIEKKIDDIDVKLGSEYATREWCEAQYGQTKKNINMIIGLIITSVVLALLKFVIIQ